MLASTLAGTASGAAGCVDFIHPPTGLRGWFVDFDRPGVPFAIEAWCGDHRLAASVVLMDRVDVDDLVGRRCRSGFGIGWSRFDGPLLSRLAAEQPDAPVLVRVPHAGGFLQYGAAPVTVAQVHAMAAAAPQGDREPAFKIVNDLLDAEQSGLFDAAWYAAANSGLPTGEPLALLLHYLEGGEAAGRQPNPYFDPVFYAESAGLQGPRGALLHYVGRGAAAGLQPSCHFHPRWYREKHALAEAVEPLQHFLAHRATLSPNRWFDAAGYLAAWRDLEPDAASPADAYLHYLETGQGLGLPASELFAAARLPTPGTEEEATEPTLVRFLVTEGRETPAATAPTAAFAPPAVPPPPSERRTAADPAERAVQLAEIIASGTFDAAYYAARNPDVVAAGRPLLEHFFEIGCWEGRSPNSVFDVDWYLGQHPGLAEALRQPLHHYVTTGEADGHRPCEWFDPSWYRGANDLAPEQSVLSHYLTHRKSGEVSPMPEFDARWYVKRYPDVAAAQVDPFEHYLRIGFREGRNPSADFDTRFYARRYLRHARNENPLLHWLRHRHEPGYHPKMPAGGLAALPPPEPPPAAAGAARAPEPRAQPGAPAQQEGFIDYFGHSPALGGWFLGGWLRGEGLRGVETCRATIRLGDVDLQDDAMIGEYARPDVAGMGFGYVCFVHAATPESGRVQGLLLEFPDGLRLRPSPGGERMEEARLLDTVRTLLDAGSRKPRTAMLRLLAQPTYQGIDTLGQLPSPVQIEVDSVSAVAGVGAVLQGWMIDPGRAIASIRVKSRGVLSPPLGERWIPMERPDVREAFASRYSFDHARLGYLCFAPMPDVDPRDMYLQVELLSGEIGFKPLPPSIGGGLATIRRILDQVRLAPDEVVERCERIIGPAIVALNRERLAAAGKPVIVEVGDLPADPRCSLIVPLYGRIDYLMYQCALFSEHGMVADEFVYVLDDPPQKQALIDLAQSAYRRFGVPMRLVLLPENLGYGPANNAGLAHSRGEYICYLNSDVMPHEPRWLDLLIAALEEDPKAGIAGSLLTFEDGTVQHAGMTFKRLPQLGNFPYAMHPGKGRIRGPSRGVQRSEAVTGACMVLRRDLAQELGGFDPSFVVGDFEDADLCMRIRARGLDCVVHEDAVLWHLERQSQGSSANMWRHNLTLVNAWIFAKRWNHLFPEAPAQDAVLRIA